MIRTVITPKNQKVSISIPINYIGKEIEIIAFEKSEGCGGNDNAFDKQFTFNALSIDTKKYKFNRDEANER